MKTKFLFSDRSGQQGFSLIEVMIALGVFLTLLIGGTFKFREMRQKMNSIRMTQSADVLASRIRDLAKSYAAFEYALTKHSGGVITRCFKNDASPCTSKSTAVFNLYMLGSTTPYTGNTVYYNMDGNTCLPSSSSCTLQVRTQVQAFCLPGDTCDKAIQPVIIIEVYDTRPEPDRLLRTQTADVLVDAREQVQSLDMQCPSGSIMKGVGLDGNAICDTIASVQYADEATLATIAVTPSSCTGNPAVINDLLFVSGIDKAGNLICTPKFW
jgi:prepilin-type N-terminal cleavage/methylation domain-containing protein